MSDVRWEHLLGGFVAAVLVFGIAALIYAVILRYVHVHRKLPPGERCALEAPPHGSGYDSRPRGLLCTRRRAHKGYHVARDYSTGRLWSWSNFPE